MFIMNDVAPRRSQMDTELMLDVGQANELKLAFRRCGYTNAEIKKLCEGDTLAKLLPVVKGLAQIVISKHLIDCDANPFVPEGWKVEQHRKGGQLEWNPERIALYLSKGQQDGKYIGGHKLRKELEDKPVLNACVLDYLLAHPDLIPESWKGKVVFFWGTIYRSADGGLYVRCLYWDGGRWSWDCLWLGLDWHGGHPAAALASV
jgi:hypothetical protein